MKTIEEEIKAIKKEIELQCAEGFDTWKTWLDSYKDKNGNIDLSHPDLKEYFKDISGCAAKNFIGEKLQNSGKTINYKISKKSY